MSLSKIAKFWRDRYFTLDKKSLKYYKQKGGQMKGEILLPGVLDCRRAHASEIDAGKEFTLVLVSVDRNWHLAARSETELTAWMTALLVQYMMHSYTILCSLYSLYTTVLQGTIPGGGPSVKNKATRLSMTFFGPGDLASPKLLRESSDLAVNELSELSEQEMEQMQELANLEVASDFSVKDLKAMLTAKGGDKDAHFIEKSDIVRQLIVVTVNQTSKKVLKRVLTLRGVKFSSHSDKNDLIDRLVSTWSMGTHSYATKVSICSSVKEGDDDDDDDDDDAAAPAGKAPAAVVPPVDAAGGAARARTTSAQKSNPMAGGGNPMAGGGENNNPLRRLQGAAQAVKATIKMKNAFHAKPTKKLTPADLKTLIGFMDEERTTKAERLSSLDTAAAMYLFTCVQLVELLKCIGIKSGEKQNAYNKQTNKTTMPITNYHSMLVLSALLRVAGLELCNHSQHNCLHPTHVPHVCTSRSEQKSLPDLSFRVLAERMHATVQIVHSIVDPTNSAGVLAMFREAAEVSDVVREVGEASDVVRGGRGE
jgi:hypothetical protein